MHKYAECFEQEAPGIQPVVFLFPFILSSSWNSPARERPRSKLLHPCMQACLCLKNQRLSSIYMRPSSPRTSSVYRIHTSSAALSRTKHHKQSKYVYISCMSRYQTFTNFTNSGCYPRLASDHQARSAQRSSPNPSELLSRQTQPCLQWRCNRL